MQIICPMMVCFRGFSTGGNTKYIFNIYLGDMKIAKWKEKKIFEDKFKSCLQRALNKLLYKVVFKDSTTHGIIKCAIQVNSTGSTLFFDNQDNYYTYSTPMENLCSKNCSLNWITENI